MTRRCASHRHGTLTRASDWWRLVKPPRWCLLPRPELTLLCGPVQVAELLLSVRDGEVFAAMLQDYRQAEAERAAGVWC